MFPVVFRTGGIWRQSCGNNFAYVNESCRRNETWNNLGTYWWTCFSIDKRHTYGYKLCFSNRRLVPLFVRDRLYTGAFQVKRKEASPIL